MFTKCQLNIRMTQQIMKLK